ncbi:hypothetical protein AAG570_011146 [Ranatra chinensis]|uniref:Uncharacterized protein n=1 Tax=Ranatra chinensis TaxID=642074 RepID=A0ABD0YK13_9HEMI
MRLCGSIQVSNRQEPSLNLPKRRSERSYLSIGTFPGKNKEPYVLLQTQRNRTGVKYKILGNVESVFTRYVNEGKATLRFKSPPHDLIINCSSAVSDLKCFLQALKHCLLGDTSTSDDGGPVRKPVHYSNLAAVPKIPPKPKTKFTVTSKQNYPHLEGFPRTLESLEINGIEMVQLDRRILRLQNLRVLNLNNNRLVSLPCEIDLLPNLRELYLSDNCLGSGGPSSWLWMTGRTIHNSLHVLDLRNNKNMFRRLEAIFSLFYQNKKQETTEIGTDLSVSHNRLLWLPGSFRKMKLINVDVSFNRMELKIVGAADCPSANRLLKPNSLVDLSAQAVLNYRIYLLRDKISQYIPIKASVSQGGVLGPPIYFIYTAGIPTHSITHMATFADDICILTSHPDPPQDHLDDLHSWCNDGGLKFDEECLPRTLVSYLEEGCYCECGKSSFPPIPEGLIPYNLHRVASSVCYLQNSNLALLAVRSCRSATCSKNFVLSPGYMTMDYVMKDFILD